MESGLSQQINERLSSNDFQMSMTSSLENPRWRIGCSLILSCLLLERFSFYAIVANFVYVLSSSPFEWSPTNALSAVLVLLASAYIIPIFAGILSDSLIGKFWVCIIGYIFYLGYLFIPLILSPRGAIIFDLKNCSDVTVYHISQECASLPIMISLISVGIGAGCIRSVMAPFGAEQVIGCYNEQTQVSERLRRYFLVYYWMNNLGAIFAFSVFAYLQQIFPSYSYVASFISIILSFGMFVCGKFFFVDRRGNGSHIRDVFGVVKDALGKKFSNSRPTFYNCTTMHDQEDLMEARVSVSNDFLDGAKVCHGGNYSESTTEKVKIFFRIIGIFLSILIFWIIYFQMNTTFLLQGLHMDVTTLKFVDIPVAWLSMFDLIAVILCVPFLGLVIFPLLRHLNYQVTPHCQIFFGMVIAVLSMLSAGLVEHYRLAMFWGNGTTTPENDKLQVIGHSFIGKENVYDASPLSIFWQIPQYLLMGCGEALITVAVLHFIFQKSPPEYLSLLNGCLWFFMAVGGIFGAFIIQGCKDLVFMTSLSWGSINDRVCNHMGCESRLAIYFFCLAGLQIVGIIVFAFIAWIMNSERTTENQITATESVVICQQYDANDMEPPVIG